MKKNILINALAIFVLSCKKPDPPKTNEPVPIAQVPVGDSSSYDALFASLRTFGRQLGIYMPYADDSYAIYSNQLIIKGAYVSGSLMNIGTVSLNGIIFKNKNQVANFYYNDTTYSKASLPHQWKILGSSVVDSFSFSNPNPYPEFNGDKFLPESGSLSTGISVNLKKASNCDLIKIVLYSGAGSSSAATKFVSGKDTIAFFKPEDLADINPTATGYFNVQFYKENYRNINGKRINFRTGLSYTNSSFLIKP